MNVVENGACSYGKPGSKCGKPGLAVGPWRSDGQPKFYLCRKCALLMWNSLLDLCFDEPALHAGSSEGK